MTAAPPTHPGPDGKIEPQVGVRDEQDAYAERTQKRCGEAIEKGLWKDETFTIEVPGRKGPTIVDADEHPRPSSTAEGMKKLKAVFKKDGTVHAGNSSGITDGAAAMLVLDADRASELGVEPMARVVDWTAAGVAPEIMGIGPLLAWKRSAPCRWITIAW